MYLKFPITASAEARSFEEYIGMYNRRKYLTAKIMLYFAKFINVMIKNLNHGSQAR